MRHHANLCGAKNLTSGFAPLGKPSTSLLRGSSLLSVSLFPSDPCSHNKNLPGKTRLSREKNTAVSRQAWIIGR